MKIRNKGKLGNMKILHLVSSGGMYGAEGVILSLSKELKKLSIDVSIGAINNKGNPHLEILERAEENGIETISFPCSGRFDLSTIFEIKNHLKQKQFDIIHSHNYKSDLYAYLASRFSDTRLCVTSHGWTSETTKVKLYEKIDRFVMKRLGGLAFECPALARFFHAAHPGVRQVCRLVEQEP